MCDPFTVKYNSILLLLMTYVRLFAGSMAHQLWILVRMMFQCRNLVSGKAQTRMNCWNQSVFSIFYQTSARSVWIKNIVDTKIEIETKLNVYVQIRPREIIAKLIDVHNVWMEDSVSPILQQTKLNVLVYTHFMENIANPVSYSLIIVWFLQVFLRWCCFTFEYKTWHKCSNDYWHVRYVLIFWTDAVP